MICLNFKDGSTIQFDLACSESDRAAWARFREGGSWSDSVTAISILARKTLHSFPVPNHELKPREIGADIMRDKRGSVSAEVVWVKVHNLKISYLVYMRNSKVTKVKVQECQ